MITIEDKHGKPFQCYADKPLVRRQIAWAVVSPELKRFYAEMAERGSLEFVHHLERVNRGW